MMLTSTLEHLSIGDAGVIALLGYSVVFFGLILLMCVITIMGKIFTAKDKKAAAASAAAKANLGTAPAAAAPVQAEIPAAPGTAGQLKQMNALDKFDEALIETPKVRKDLGYPPLVTPTSQMVGVQAVTNVLQGERYKKVSKDVKAYCRGEYGRTPAPIDPEIKKIILGDDQPIEGRYADTLAPIVEPTRQKLGDLAKTDEDVLSYIAFPNLAEKFLEERKAKEENVVTYSIVEA